MQKLDLWQRVNIVALYNGFKQPTIWKWRQRGEVPKAHRFMLVHTAIEAGVKLTIKELG
jgi:hypothetical protein